MLKPDMFADCDNDTQRFVKLGMVHATRHFLASLPIEVVTPILIAKTVQLIWNDYMAEPPTGN